MSTIISILVKYNQLLLSQINQLLIFIAKNIPLSKLKYDMTSPKYNKHIVDKSPIIKTFKRLDYKQLLSEYNTTHCKEKKPVNSRGKNPVSPDTVCPQCGAPHTYIYDNTGGRGQLRCKVFDLRFNKTKVDFKTETFICPMLGSGISTIRVIYNLSISIFACFIKGLLFTIFLSSSSVRIIVFT
nr:hypothetical protein [Clostridium bowmanii]